MRSEDPTLPVSVPPGPENPMGTHALYLGFPTIAIHGTNKPYGIGRRVSSGCIRMFPEDITQMFSMAPVGTKVTVVDQPIKAHMALKMGLLNEKEFDRIVALFHKIPLKTGINGVVFDDLMRAMRHDKKAKDNKLRFALPKSLGETVIEGVEDETLIFNAFNFARENGWKQH